VPAGGERPSEKHGASGHDRLSTSARKPASIDRDSPRQLKLTIDLSSEYPGAAISDIEESSGRFSTIVDEILENGDLSKLHYECCEDATFE